MTVVFRVKEVKQMVESEYRLSLFENKFEKYKNKRIGIFGTGIHAKNLLSQFPDYNFIVLINEGSEDSYIYGKRVVPIKDLVNLQLDLIVIADMFLNAQRIYQRIALTCRQMNIEVFNLYGWNMRELNCILEEHMAKYVSYTSDDLKRVIDEYDVVSFDFFDTLIVRTNLIADDRFKLLEKKLVASGIAREGFAEVRRITGNECAAKLPDIHVIYEKIVEKGALRQEDVEKAILEEEAIEESGIIARKDVVEVLNAAIGKAKEIYIISDLYWSSEFHQKILSKIGVKGDVKLMIYHTEKRSKYDGIYRKLKDQCPGKKCLHIGDDEIGDGLMPYMHGLDSFPVKSALSCFHSFSEYKFDFNKLEQGNNALIMGLYIAHNFNSPFFNQIGRYESHILEQSAALVCEHSFKKLPVIKYRPEILLEENEDKPLEFEEFENPRVSIIIPVYNQYFYTYCCLKAILQNTTDVSYEIIIADDCSDDKTKELEKYVRGIRVIHNKCNMKFLLNCKNAAQNARGEFILFLNNDTQVQYNWLAPLARVMDASKQIGMAGSKLVYPDGYLQEAGGIVWKDASAWNYGNLQNPDDAPYCYVKNADYISGASLMIRKKLWDEIGGFDEVFVPAYYEDTDLAFEVRKRGYEVVFQPESVVVHFEGISNGTDVMSGLKSYQIANEKKFYEKWKDELAKNHFTNAGNVYLAKDRGQFRKQILVVDHYVPNYDKDAGGRCTYMYLKTFVRLGFKVTFIGDNFARPQPYTDELNQMGIEVLYGDYYYLNIKEWLKENLMYFDYVYLQRPHISIKYIDLVKEYSEAKVFYFAHDLHHIREYREYQLTHDIEKLKSSQRWKRIEYELFSKTDVGHVVGSYEQAVLQEKFPDKIIRNIPLYIYEGVLNDVNKNFGERKDIVYVGGFKHAPNIDAVIWFANEIFPKVLKEIPDMKWHIVGGSAPDEVKALASDHIILDGYISDEALVQLYSECRVAVVPLRVGAGVKGKVVEAAYYQIPLITTSIGAEGLSTEEGAFLVEDDPEKFARLLCEIYNDNDRLKQISDNQMAFIEKYFTVPVAEKVLRDDL